MRMPERTQASIVVPEGDKKKTIVRLIAGALKRGKGDMADMEKVKVVCDR
jgi:hypothetical protein